MLVRSYRSKSQSRSLAFAACVLLALTAPALAGKAATFVGLGFLNSSIPVSESPQLDSNGTVVVGDSYIGESQSEAYSWTRSGGIVGLGLLSNANLSFALGVSGEGSTIVGESGTTSVQKAFLWSQKKGMAALGSGTDWHHSSATATDDNGSVIVGTLNDQAFRWTKSGGAVGLGFLSGSTGVSDATGTDAAGDVVVGYSSATGGGHEAFYWTSNLGMVGLGQLSAGASSYATAVSADGNTVVGYSSGATETAFYWTVLTGLHSLNAPKNAPFTNANGVSQNGSIIVGCARSNPNKKSSIAEAVQWDNGTVQKISAIVAKYGISLTGWSLTCATSISADGKSIAGNGVDPAGHQEAWLFQVE